MSCSREPSLVQWAIRYSTAVRGNLAALTMLRKACIAARRAGVSKDVLRALANLSRACDRSGPRWVQAMCDLNNLGCPAPQVLADAVDLMKSGWALMGRSKTELKAVMDESGECYQDVRALCAAHGAGPLDPTAFATTLAAL